MRRLAHLNGENRPTGSSAVPSRLGTHRYIRTNMSRFFLASLLCLVPPLPPPLRPTLTSESGRLPRAVSRSYNHVLGCCTSSCSTCDLDNAIHMIILAQSDEQKCFCAGEAGPSYSTFICAYNSTGPVSIRELQHCST